MTLVFKRETSKLRIYEIQGMTVYIQYAKRIGVRVVPKNGGNYSELKINIEPSGVSHVEIRVGSGYTEDHIIDYFLSVIQKNCRGAPRVTFQDNKLLSQLRRAGMNISEIRIGQVAPRIST